MDVYIYILICRFLLTDTCHSWLSVFFTGKDGGQKHENILKTELDKIIANIGFGGEGIATETTVVDSEGQRLVLRIDNVLGGGGQRKVVLYCPFWIVNTSQHALRYKQEGKSAFVSGTVSEKKDGSRPVDGSERNAREKNNNRKKLGSIGAALDVIKTRDNKKNKRQTDNAEVTTPSSLKWSLGAGPESRQIASRVPPVSTGPPSIGPDTENSLLDEGNLKSQDARKRKEKKRKTLRLSDPAFTFDASSTVATSLASPKSSQGGSPTKGDHAFSCRRDKTIFSGKPGALYVAEGEALTEREYNITRSRDLPLSQLVKLSFMFNFNENVLSLGHQKLCVMLAEGSKGLASDWSQGYSLDTVGVTQILSMHVADGRSLEASLSISVAPGRLGQYTKIVRFSPRYVIVNMLPYPITLRQDSSLLHNSYAASSTGRWQGFAEHQQDGNQRKEKSALDVLFGRDTGAPGRFETSKVREKNKSKSTKSILFGIVDDNGGGDVHDRARRRRSKLGKSAAIEGTGKAQRSLHRESTQPILRSRTHGLTRTGNLMTNLIPPDGFAPFFLPDTRADRCLRIDPGSQYSLTSSFPADSPGVYTLKLNKPLDPRNLPHVTTRNAACYEVKLPPDDKQIRLGWSGELGVWFETDWDHRGIVVKGCKRGKYAFNHTEIHAGDVLTAVDGTSIGSKSFDEVMALLKDRLKVVEELNSGLMVMGDIGDYEEGNERIDIKDQLVLEFMTLEERMKKVRKKALDVQRKSRGQINVEMGSKEFMRQMREEFGEEESNDSDKEPGEGREDEDDPSSYGSKSNYDKINNFAAGVLGINNMSSIDEEDRSSDGSLGYDTRGEDYICVDMTTVGNSLFLYVQPSLSREPPYRVENSSSRSVISFKQRNCDGHPWMYLKPGESGAYMWEEPMKPRKLALRASDIDAIDRVNNFDNLEDSSRKRVGASRSSRFFGIDNEYDDNGSYGNCKTVKLDEIGFTECVPLAGLKDEMWDSSNNLWCRVDAVDGTKTLKITDRDDIVEESLMMRDYKSTIKRELANVDESLQNLRSMKAELNAIKKRSSLVDLSPSSRASDAADNDLALLGYSSGPLKNTATDNFLSPSASEKGSFASPVSPADSSSTLASPLSANKEHYNQTLARIKDSLCKDNCNIPDGCSITQCNQILVQVIECCGLKASTLGGLSNPYTEVSLKNHTKKRRIFQEKKLKTYFIEKTVNPKWSNQIFVINVPEVAIKATRGFSLMFVVKNFEFFGTRDFLGQCDVQLSSLSNQTSVEGWYPLTPRTGKVFQRSSNEKVSGSIKLRLQWVHSAPTLLNYRISFMDERKAHLQNMARVVDRQLKDIERRKLIAARRLLAPAHGSKSSIERRARKKKHSIQRKSVNRRRERPPIKSRRARSIGNGIGKVGSSMKKMVDEVEKEVVSAAQKMEKGLRSTLLTDAKNKSRTKSKSRKGTPRLSTIHLGNEKRIMPHTRTLSRRSSPWYNNENISPYGKANLSLDERLAAKSLASPAGEFHLSDTDVAMQNNDFVASRDTVDGGSNVNDSDLGELPAAGSMGGDLSSEDNDNALDGNSKMYYISSTRGETLSKDDCQILDECENGKQEALEEAQRLENARFREAFLMMKKRGLIHGSVLMFHERHKIFSYQNKNEMSKFRNVEKYGAPELTSFRTMTDAVVWLNFSRTKRSYFVDDEATEQEEQNSTNVSVTCEGGLIPVAKGGKGNSQDDDSHLKNVDKEMHVDEVYAVEQGHNKDELSAAIARNKLPSNFPCHTKNLAIKRAIRTSLSRTSFKKAAQRSLRNSLMTGGWLTIKAITALNLPDSNKNKFVYVRVRFSNETHVSHKADARVAPKWEDEDLVEGGSSGGDVNYDKRDRKDIKVYVESLKTSGTIDLTVLGERDLQTDVELGVLQIPLSGALDCVGEGPYTRWFPLRSPDDCVALEGDNGESLKPLESEKLTDREFDDFYTTCIKLKLTWEPFSNDQLEGSQSSGHLEGGTRQAKKKRKGRETDKVKRYAMISLGSISASLIDSTEMSELLTLSVSDFGLRYADTERTTKIGATIGWFQLDHQLDNAYAPVMVAPTPVPSVQPTLQLSILKDNLKSSDKLHSFIYCGVLLQELDLKVEENIIRALHVFAHEIWKRRQKREVLKTGGKDGRDKKTAFANVFDLFEEASKERRERSMSEGIEIGENIKDEELGPVQKFLSRKIYIEELSLGSVKVNVSYFKGNRGRRAGVAGTMAEGREVFGANTVMGGGKKVRVNKNDTIKTRIEKNRQRAREAVKGGGLVDDDELERLSDFPSVVSAVIPSLTDAAIRLNGKELNNVFESGWFIVNSLKEFYVNEGLKQIYKVIGSLEIIGNPNQLLSSLGTGVRDFFYEPALGIVKSPTALGVGMVKGTLSLVSHTTSGVFSFASKLSMQVGTGVATLSLDDDFKQRHARSQEERSRFRVTRKRDVLYLAFRPIADIAYGVAEGAKGVVMEPYKGVKKNGASGLFLGVFLGILGIPAKPIVGLADAFTHASMAFRDVATGINLLEKRMGSIKRRKLPYDFGLDGRLCSYNYVNARCVKLLKDCVVELGGSGADGSGGVSGGVDDTQKLRLLNDECIVWSECLKMGRGKDLYVMCTTSRMVCIEVTKEGGSRQFSAEVKWECHLPQPSDINSGYDSKAKRYAKQNYRPSDAERDVWTRGRRIVAKIQNANHNGVGLHILEGSENAIAMAQGFGGNGGVDVNGNGGTFGTTDGEHHKTGYIALGKEGGKLVKLGATSYVAGEGGNNLGPSKNAGNDLNVFVINAEFQHRQQLLRAGNVLNCMTEEWENIDEDEGGLDYEGSMEGVFKFGDWDFRSGALGVAVGERTNMDEESEALCGVLEYATWGRRGGGAGATLALKDDEMETAKLDGGAQWLIEAHRDAMFVSAMFPRLPLEPNVRHDREVEILRYELFLGNMSLEEVNDSLDKHIAVRREEIDAERLQEEEDESINNYLAMMAADASGDQLSSNESDSGGSDTELDEGGRATDDGLERDIVGSFAAAEGREPVDEQGETKAVSREFNNSTTGVKGVTSSPFGPTSSPAGTSVLTDTASCDTIDVILTERLNKVEGMLEILLARNSSSEGIATSRSPGSVEGGPGLDFEQRQQQLLVLQQQQQKQIAELLQQISTLTGQQRQRKIDKVAKQERIKTSSARSQHQQEERRSSSERNNVVPPERKKTIGAMLSGIFCCTGTVGTTGAVEEGVHDDRWQEQAVKERGESMELGKSKERDDSAEEADIMEKKFRQGSDGVGTNESSNDPDRSQQSLRVQAQGAHALRDMGTIFEEESLQASNDGREGSSYAADESSQASTDTTPMPANDYDYNYEADNKEGGGGIASAKKG